MEHSRTFPNRVLIEEEQFNISEFTREDIDRNEM